MRTYRYGHFNSLMVKIRLVPKAHWRIKQGRMKMNAFRFVYGDRVRVVGYANVFGTVWGPNDSGEWFVKMDNGDRIYCPDDSVQTV